MHDPTCDANNKQHTQWACVWCTADDGVMISIIGYDHIKAACISSLWWVMHEDLMVKVDIACTGPYNALYSLH